jgi:nucleoside-diphosphate-sugar epimerase
MAKLNVLLTGASGRIGRHIVKPLQQRYALRTLDLRPVPDDPTS